MALQVGLGRGSAMDPRVGVDEGQVLALLVGEADPRRRPPPPLRCLWASPAGGAAMTVRYRVELSEAERHELRGMLDGGRHAARKLKRAQILLASDAGMPDETIGRGLAVSGSTVYRTKRRFVEGNLARALNEEPRPGAARKLSGQEETLLVATACSSPPEGRARWTLELLAGEMLRLTEHHSLSRETVRRRLAANVLKPWPEEMWCVPHIDHEYVARYDYEYRRCGTVHLFVAMDAHRPWRKVTVSERRTARDYAARLRELVDVDYPDAKRIRVVQDNLSTHTPGALYEAFPAAEARRILRRLEFHYTPKHASWLNMVEIEIGVLKRQCLDRRIEDRAQLEAEIAAWEGESNASRARVRWMFTTETARAKMSRAYPQHAAAPDPTAKPSSPLCRTTRFW